MSIEAKAGRRVRVIQRRVRWFVIAAIVVGAALFTYRYDFDKIPENYHHLVQQNIRAGERIVLVRFDEDTVIGPEAVVLYSPPGHDEHRCFGAVAGMPGEVVRIERVEGRGAKLHVGERRELLKLPEGHRLAEGPIPAGHLLLLNGDRSLGRDAVHPDSRFFGLIPFDRIESKVFPLRFQ